MLAKPGISVVLVPGGIQEIFYSDEDVEMLYLKDRKGFCKLALCQGSPLVPIYVLGHTQMFSYFPGRGSLFERLSRRFRVSLVHFYGRFYLPVPRPSPLVYVIGRPLAVKRTDNPTAAEVGAL